MSDTLTRAKPSKREPPEVRRQAILQAAAAVFLERGYTDASIDAVVERAGGSKATVYAMFGNKEGLFSAVLAMCGDEFSAALDTVPVCTSLRDSLRRVARAYLTMSMHPKRLAMFRMVAGESGQRPEGGDIFYRLGPRRALTMVGKFLRECADKGLLKTDEPELLADCFLGALRGNLFTRAMLNPTRLPTPQEIEARIDFVVDVLLKGVQPGPGDCGKG